MTTHAEPEPLVIDADVIAVDGVPVEQLMPQPLSNPPAVRTTCACGKNGTPEAHGWNPRTQHRALTCREVLEMQARIEADCNRRTSLIEAIARRVAGGAR